MKDYSISVVKKSAEKKQLTQELHDNLREVDRKEIEGLGFSSMQGVEISIRDTCPVFVARSRDGKLIACWGLEILDFKRADGTHDYTYVIWALGTDEMEHYKKAFVRESSAIIKRWVELYGCLENTVATFNTRAIRWLKWMGAEFGEPYKMGTTEYMNFKIKRKEK